MIVIPGFVVFLALCALVGYLGRDRKFGFWGYFFVSILFTPVVGLLTVFASYKRSTTVTLTSPVAVPIVPVS